MKFVLIEWVDSCGCSSNWEVLDKDYDPVRMVCRSVGWLFHDGPHCKVLVPHIADIPGDTDKQGCGHMTIPSVCILKIYELHEPPDGTVKEPA